MLTLKKLEKLFFLLTIIFLPTQLGKHFWPEFSFIYSLPIDYLSPTLYFWDILVLILWLIFLLRRGHINEKALSLAFLFLLTQALSLFAKGANFGTGMIRLEQYLLVAIFGVYIASQNFIRIRDTVFIGLSVALVSQSMLAIFQFIAGKTLGLWILGERTFTLTTPGIAKFDFYGRQLLRPYATFPHPNVLSAYLLISILLNCVLQKGTKKIQVQSILGAAALLLTFSRVTIFAGFVSGIYFLNKRWKVILILTAFLLSPILFTRFSAVLNYDNLSLLRRAELSFSAFQSFISAPVLGIGLNNFIPYLANQLTAGPNRFLQPVHNIFLLTLAESGIIGFLGLLGLIGYPIWRLFKRRISYKHRTIMLIWLVILFLGLFDHYFLTLPQGQRLLFLVWGLSFSVLELSDESSADNRI